MNHHYVSPTKQEAAALGDLPGSKGVRSRVSVGKGWTPASVVITQQKHSACFAGQKFQRQFLAFLKNLQTWNDCGAASREGSRLDALLFFNPDM